MKSPACRVCHKPLSDPRSLARGMGPKCHVEHGGQIDIFLPRPPAYSFHVCEFGGKSVLCILDEYDEARPTLTVTNGAEYVLAEVAKSIGALPEIVIYRDSSGRWDRLKAKREGTFLRFAPIVPGRVEAIVDQVEAVQLAVLSSSKINGSNLKDQ